MKECWTLEILEKKNQKPIGIPHDSTKTGNIEIIKQVFFQSEWKVESSYSIHGKEKYGSCYGKQQLIS